jgi:exopolyphosphatase / guanosine-5'-triphosphate,3'-diphosphate pyrophosphatase
VQQRIAVIDIGTNTLLLLIAELQGSGEIIAIVDECRFGRLGKGLDASGELATESIATSLAICREYRAILDQHGVDTPAIVATQAMREARNAGLFVTEAQAILRAPLQIIAGEREAQLAAASVRGALPHLHGKRYIVVDVGGGSTEFIVTDGVAIESAVSVAVGAVRMTERFLRNDPPQPQDIAELTEFLSATLAPLQLPTGLPMVATAGTATTIAAVALEMSSYDTHRVTGFTLNPAQLIALCQRMATSTVAQRKTWPGMVPQRADVIAGGAIILQVAASIAQSSVFIVCDRGIRWGLATELLQNRSTSL